MLNNRAWTATGDIGIKVLPGELVLDNVASTPAAKALDIIMNSIHVDAKAGVANTMKSHRVRLTRDRYTGPRCSFPLDLTTVTIMEFVTPSSRSSPQTRSKSSTVT